MLRNTRNVFTFIYSSTYVQVIYLKDITNTTPNCAIEDQVIYLNSESLILVNIGDYGIYVVIELIMLSLCGYILIFGQKDVTNLGMNSNQSNSGSFFFF